MVHLEIEGTITEVDFLNVMKQNWSISSLYTLVAPSLPPRRGLFPSRSSRGGGVCVCVCVGVGACVCVCAGG